jgi:hypothetical protein
VCRSLKHVRHGRAKAICSSVNRFFMILVSYAKG